ncbi:thiamine pyrophosphate-binding protein [Streptomyces sp. NPDC051104]|uniref:thiamine pyrophosphate-binding protein n=1 Tax=Streptomyces sp. NPDC051104 TaxID=3155044 RepID=UPI003422D0C9
MTTVREATIDLLRKHGLNTWFGNPGSSELTLMEEFPRDFRYLLGLQEMVPVGMADGFSQVTGRPALVMLHTAPGLGNGMGALYNAYLNKTPLIVIAGNQRRTMQNQKTLLTNEDATMVPRPFAKWTAEPAIASEVPAVLARAIHVAMSPPTGPVFVSVPMDDAPTSSTTPRSRRSRRSGTARSSTPEGSERTWRRRSPAGCPTRSRPPSWSTATWSTPEPGTRS